MKIEEIVKMWKEDSQIDIHDLANASIESAKLHAKYIDFLMKERQKKIAYEHDLNKHKAIKLKYFKGFLDFDELNELGLKQFSYDLNNTEINVMVESDNVIQSLKTKLYLCEQKIYLLEQILKQISNRNFLIKNNIDWIKYQNGF